MVAFSSLLKAVLRIDDHPHVPDPWRAAFLRALGKPARTAVALCCKGALQLLLEEWHEATLSISVRASAGHPTEKLVRQLYSARAQLATRRSQPTTLLLQQRGQLHPDDEWWLVHCTALAPQDSTPHLTLSLDLCHTPPQLLALAAQAFSGLSVLNLCCPEHWKGEVELPAPSVWPALRKLTIGAWFAEGAQAALWASVGPYLLQLVSLVVGDQGDEHVEGADLGIVRPVWSSIFSAQHTTHTLTELTIPCDLRPWLVKLLAQHTPALVSLGCVGVRAITDAGELQGVPVHCPWRTLRFEEPAQQCANHMAWLPTPGDGPLVIELWDSCDGVELYLPVTGAVSVQAEPTVYLQDA